MVPRTSPKGPSARTRPESITTSRSTIPAQPEMS